LENYDFKQWRNDQQSHLLWIKGDPGKGKTMLLCGIVNELKKSIAGTHLLSYFFCQATDSRINNATAVLRAFLTELHSVGSSDDAGGRADDMRCWHQRAISLLLSFADFTVGG